MTRGCPTTEDMVLLIDGELTENRATWVRDHLSGCAACREEVASVQALVRNVAAPIEPSPGALERLLARLDEARAAPAPRWRPVLAGVLGLAAVAAAVALIPAAHLRRSDPDGFTARGAPAQPSIARDVGVTLYRHAGRLDLLAAGDYVTAQTAYAVSFRNLGADGSAYLAIFAQDSAGEVHWIEPTWVDPAQDPASVPLPHADRESPPRTSVVLERPAVGAMHLFVLVTPVPVRVSEVERFAGTTVDAVALRTRWPGATVDETVVSVVVDAENTTP
ncbi:MAG: anti-sigma factor family protein [Polyangiaceae bacterium]